MTPMPGSELQVPDGTRLLHITTIPMSLVFLRGQVGWMKRRGFVVHALASPGEQLQAFGHVEGVTVHAVAMPRRITPVRDLMAVARLLAVLRHTRPTIVHAHTPKGGLLGMIAATLARTPVRIYHMRGLPLMGATGAKHALLRFTERVACRLAHRVICVSHSVRDEAIRLGLCPADHIRVLAGGSGNGVDAAMRFNPQRLGAAARCTVRARAGIPADAVVIGFVGRLVRDKGISELVAAWRQLRARHPHLHMLLVGPFEPQDPVPADDAALLRTDERVHLAGEDWDTPRLYAAMDLVALPSYREGFPNVPLEAAAMALPVVSTRVPGCSDAVADGVTGTLVPVRDSAALASALHAYISDPALRRSHGEAGRARVLREFRQEVIWTELLREYAALLGTAAGETAAAPPVVGAPA